MNDTSEKSSAAGIAGYALLWLFFVYLYVQIFSFHQANITNPILAGLYLIQFGVHEISHLLFAFLPDVLTAASGSLSEIVFTSLIVLAALRAKSNWAVIFGLLWLMLAMISAGNYMADARLQAMPLMGPSPDPQHDWHFVFSELGWLNADTAIGTAVKVIGRIAGAIGLLYGLLLIVKKIGWFAAE